MPGLRAVPIAAAVWLVLAGIASAATVPSAQHPTIQSAIDDVARVPNGSTIEVLPGVYREALLVNVGRSLTIRGVGGAASTIVDAAGRGAAAINIYRSGAVVIQGLTFRKGAPPTAAGGGFVVEGASPSFIDCVFEYNTARDGAGGTLLRSDATFTNCVFRHNTAAHFGGGVYIAWDSRPVFTRCEFVDNASGAGEPGVANTGAGGGVFSLDSSPTLRHSRIARNTSMFAAGGVFHMGVFGSSHGRATLTVEDTEIADNVSTQFSPEENPAEGGGIHVEDNATATLRRVRVLRNRAGTGGGLNAYRGQYDVIDSVVADNQAVNGFGGGVAATSNNVSGPVYPASVVNLTRTLVRGNTASGAGGGVVVVGDPFCGESTPTCIGPKATLSLTDSVVEGNQSTDQAGGILLNRTNLVARGSLILRNRVRLGVFGFGFGGGLAITVASTAAIEDTTFAENVSDQYGGAVFMNSGTIQMNGSHLYGNTSPPEGGGGVFVGPAEASGYISNSTIADNAGYQIVEHRCPAPVDIALAYQDNAISGGTGVYHGGCVALESLDAFNGYSAVDGTTGNTATPPTFASFVAVPGSGVPATLTWAVARAATVSIGGVGAFDRSAGTVDVAPSESTTYTLTASITGGSSVEPLEARVTVDRATRQVAPPTGLSVAAVTGNAVTLTWAPPAQGLPPANYLIEGGLTPGEVIASLPTGSAAPQHTFTVPAGVYYLRVRAQADGERSAASNEVRVNVNVPAPPSPPTNLLGLVNGSSLALTWKNTFADGPPTGLVLDVSGAVTTSIPLGLTESFSFDGVPPGTYTLRVRATGPTGSSAPSNAVTLSFPGACSGVPLGVENLAVSRTGDQVLATWDPPPAGPAGTAYVVSVTGTFVGSFQVPGRSLSGVAAPGSYELSVAATNACGTGPFSPPQTVVVP